MVVLFSLPSYKVVGEVGILFDGTTKSHVFRDVPSGNYEVIVASYSGDTGFRYENGVAMVTVQ